jgi:hypothetical protein
MSINNIYSQLVIVAGVNRDPDHSVETGRFRKNGPGQRVRPRHGPHNGFQISRRCTANSVVSTGKDNIGGTFNECRLSKNIPIPQTVAPRPMEPRAPHLSLVQAP